MKKQLHGIFEYEGKSYPCYKSAKPIRNLIIRLNKEGDAILLSVPFFTGKGYIDAFIDKSLPKLIKKSKKKKEPIEDGFIYEFGEKKEYVNQDDKYIKKSLLAYLDNRVRYFEKAMNISPLYRIKVRNMSTRFGSNSRKTYSLCFASSLFHFHPLIIDSVIVHELCHHYHFDHSASFYSLLLQYCPYYKKARKSLIEKDYEGSNLK